MTRLFRPDLPFAPRKLPFFYGWVVVAAGSLGMILSTPGQTVGVSVFTDFLIAALELDRATLSLAYMLGTIISSLFLPYAGRVFDRVGARRMIVGVSLLFGFAILLMGFSPQLLNMLAKLLPGLGRASLAFGLIMLIFLLLRQFGQGLLAMVSRTMISKWFDQKRGLAIGASGLVTALGFNSSPALMNALVNLWDWQTTCLFLAALVGIGMTVLGWLLFRDSPEECGLRMDGSDNSETSQAAAHLPDKRSKRKLSSAGERNFSLKEARGTLAFWLFNLGMGMQALLTTAVTFHLASIGEQSGMERDEIFLLLIPTSIVSAGINLIGGWMSDRFAMKYLLMIQMLSLSSGLVATLFLDVLAGRLAYIIGLGISSGLFGVLSAVVWPRFFGRLHLGGISGLNMATMVFCSAIGPPLFGYCFALTGAYAGAVLFCALLPLIIMAASYKANNPQPRH